MMLITPLIDYFFSEYVVTNKRLIAKKGLIRIESLEIILSKVEGILLEQSIIGRILGYGSIIVIGTGGTKDPLRQVASPLIFKRIIQTEISKIRQ